MNDRPSHSEVFQLLGKRASTIKTCFQILNGRGADVSVLELGTSRSFRSGVIDTSNFISDYKAWDWGAGCFTAAIKILVPHCALTSVDPNPQALAVARALLAGINADAQFHQLDSTTFLESAEQGYDLIYMDHAESGGDDRCAILHRNDAATIVGRQLIKPGGLILIDDIDTPFNKGMYSMPYLEANGFSRLSYNSYQALYRRD
jgi:hypothetical protein